MRVGWFWFDRGTGFGSVVIWASGCLVGVKREVDGRQVALYFLYIVAIKAKAN